MKLRELTEVRDGRRSMLLGMIGSLIIVEFPGTFLFLPTARSPCWCLWRGIRCKRNSQTSRICARKSNAFKILKARHATSDNRTISGRKVSRHAVTRYPLPPAVILRRRALSDATVLYASLIPAVAAGFPRFPLIVLERLDLLRASPRERVRLGLACRRHVHYKPIIVEGAASRERFTANDICSASTRIAWSWRSNSRFCVFERPAFLAAAESL